MGAPFLDWEDIAFDHGFQSDKELFLQWYKEEKQSMETIGRKLGLCASTISKRLKFLSVPINQDYGPRAGILQGPRLPCGK